VGIRMLRALRPGRWAARGGKLLDLPLLQLIRQVGEPLRHREAQQDADTLRPRDQRTGGTGRLDPGGQAIRPQILACLFHDVGHDRVGGAQVAQDRL
jgi:hypothetical protein